MDESWNVLAFFSRELKATTSKIKSQVLLNSTAIMFSLIQRLNLRWIPKALSLSLSPQIPPTQLAKDMIQENVASLTALLIDSNRKKLNWHPQRIFGKLSTEVLSRCNIPYYRTPYDIRSSWSMHSRSASSKMTPSTKSIDRELEVHSLRCWYRLHSICTSWKLIYSSVHRPLYALGMVQG